ncbi:MAG: hypothetical protein ACPF9K_03520 [Neptuniibacter sp.]
MTKLGGLFFIVMSSTVVGEDRTWPRDSRQANAYGLQRYANGDTKGLKNGRQRVVRGGSWDENINNLRSSFRNVKPPISGRSIYGSIGFRCVYDPK